MMRKEDRSSLVAQQVKCPVLSLLWFRSNPWPRTSACFRHGRKEKKRRKDGWKEGKTKKRGREGGRIDKNERP